MTEYGIVQTGQNLGDFSTAVSGSYTQLYFTPIANANIQVRVFQQAMRLINTVGLPQNIDFTNASINTGYGTYEGTFTDVRRAFDLNYNQYPIFQKTFSGVSSSIVDITNNVLNIPQHYFITGEKLTYTPPTTASSIGIATTSIPGIGVTNLLPSTVYAIKVDDNFIRVAASSTDALKTIPNYLDFTSVGLGTNHTLTSSNQNSRILISIDNIIQSPIVSTSVTTTTSLQTLITDNTITVSGISSFFGGDLIQIDNEIMRINSVGFGSTNVFLVERPWMGTGISSHISGSLVTKINGDYNIVGSTINFITSPQGLTPIGTTIGSPYNVDYTGIQTHSTFSGRSFMRSGVSNGSTDSYSKNYVFDDISASFTGYNTSFNLTSNKSNISGFSTSNAIILLNDVFQGPKRSGANVNIIGDYTLKENSGITSIQFTGTGVSAAYDPNTSTVPIGGVIVSVGSSQGLGYQPLVAAGGTAVVSGFGTIQSISIGNSGSGYRSGVQNVKVGVQTASTGVENIQYIGIATISNGNIVGVSITNPGIGYTSSNPPIVVFDSPLSYSNIPLIYSSSSRTGFGTQAKINIVVGQGSSIISFELQNYGYGYGQGEILTVGLGGTVGIPTNSSIPFQEFQILVSSTISNKFTGWTFGDLQVLDPLDNLFDGTKITFPLSIDNVQTTIQAKKGSQIDIQATLLVFINGILQVPGKGYSFSGGSYITFPEPPQVGDTSKILFYKGSGDIDVAFVDILPTIKVGDEVTLNDDNLQYQENTRIVTSINATDNINTNPYSGPGITRDANYTRPVLWCKQTEDKIVDGVMVTKDRVLYEALIQPNARLIQPVGYGSTVAFVDNIRTFFDSAKENNTAAQATIKIISQDSIISAAATAIVSVAGTISSLLISNGGIGYTVAPSVTISSPIGLGTTAIATGISSISSGIVTSVTIINPGFGYTTSNPPVVLFASPTSVVEKISNVSYYGDFGYISGVAKTSVGVASTGLIFDLVIPLDSDLRKSSVVGSAITVSGIQTGYYFVVQDSNIGNGVTSLYTNGSVVGFGSTCIDNIYQVAAVSIAQTSVSGIGLTYVAKVTVSISNYNGLTGTGYSSFFGKYSWGLITIPTRINAKSFNTYNNALPGVSTSPVVERYNPLSYLNYNP